MSPDSKTIAGPKIKLDYSLTGVNANLAIEQGLAEADWYQMPGAARDDARAARAPRRPRDPRHAPLVRAALRQRLRHLSAVGHLVGDPPLSHLRRPLRLRPPTPAGTRAGHGTAFKTDWMNNALYEIASFMVMRESTVWRWSHTRHHSDTIIVGRDPEIAVPRPPDLQENRRWASSASPCIRSTSSTSSCTRCGRMTADEKTFIPESEFPKIYPQGPDLRRHLRCA